MRLETQLKHLGFPGTADRFRNIVRQRYLAMFPFASDEEVLTSPTAMALPLVESVRQDVGLDLPEDLILKTLINERKAGRCR